MAVPDEHDPRRWQLRTLGELQPYHWVKAVLASADLVADESDPSPRPS